MALIGTVKDIDVDHGSRRFDKQQDTDIDEIIAMRFLFFIILKFLYPISIPISAEQNSYDRNYVESSQGHEMIDGK